MNTKAPTEAPNGSVLGGKGILPAVNKIHIGASAGALIVLVCHVCNRVSVDRHPVVCSVSIVQMIVYRSVCLDDCIAATANVVSKTWRENDEYQSAERPTEAPHSHNCHSPLEFSDPVALFVTHSPFSSTLGHIRFGHSNFPSCR